MPTNLIVRETRNPKGEMVQLVKDGVLYLVKLSGPDTDLKCATHNILLASYVYDCLARRA